MNDEPTDTQSTDAQDPLAEVGESGITLDASPVATAEPVEMAPKVKEDVVHWCYDNEHADGVLCTLTFKDGSTATGTATSTGNLADDQAVASAKALSSV